MDDRWALSVTELNEYVRKKLAADPILRAVEVRGEISGYKRHFSGHHYFTLKDEGARVQCVMLRQQAASLTFEPEDGMRVVLRAGASLYAPSGSFQLYVNSMKPEGAGELFLRLEQLKKRLAEEGLFDPARKRDIPMLPKYIGVATSRTGAVIRDIIRVAKRRDPNVGILLAPCAVQGTGAAAEIVRAIERLNADGRPDVILVGRGGGSMEDLWPFNEEIVARAIVASNIPVISCVGHEVDFTIADFAADARASTPSNAAELAVPVVADLRRSVEKYARSLVGALLRAQEIRRAQLRTLANSAALAMPRLMLIERREAALGALAARLGVALARRGDAARGRLQLAARALAALNPQNVLARGYAAVVRDGNFVSDASQLRRGDKIQLRMRDADASAEVV